MRFFCNVTDTIKFLLYNIRYGTGTGLGYHLPLPFAGYFRPSVKNTSRIVDFIKENQPDIIGLVEVDEGSYRSGKINQAQWIAEELGYHPVHETKYGTQSLARKMPILNRQGNAFVTRRHVVAERFHFLETGMKRLVIELEFDNFVIFLVHLSLTFNSRQRQLTGLNRIFQGITKPIIVAGDFNALTGSGELELFMNAANLINANSEELPTFPSIMPWRQLDFILHSPEIQMQNFAVCPVRYSDHMPVLCEFSCPSAA
jgi:endonuclease/exonuclease/phosphatase family metal-dependent hydrolase